MGGVELWSGRVGLPDWLGRSIMKGGREGRCAELALGVAAREVERGMRM